MIFLYTERLIDVDLPQVMPTCEAVEGRIIPLVSEDLSCLSSALRSASRGVVLKTTKRTWVALAREIRPDLPLYVWGLALRGRNIIPIYEGDYRGRGIYYVKEKRDLYPLGGRPIEGVLLDAKGFNPHIVELVSKRRLKCGCSKCDLVEMLTCDAYKEVEVL